MKKNSVLLAMKFAALGIVFSLSGCNTVRGVGQDIEKGGEAIQRAVK